jgi:integrase
MSQASKRLCKISKRFVEKEINEEGWYRDSELKGFCVRARLTSDGELTKTYAINNSVRGSGRQVTVTIGRHGVVSAEKARIEAIRILAEMARGEDPNHKVRKQNESARKEISSRKQRAQLESRTVSYLLDDYLRTHNLKERTARRYRQLVTRLFEEWMDVPVNQISRDMVQEKHLELSSEHPAQANYAMRVLRAMFKYALAVYEDDQGKPLLIMNPVDRLSHARLWNKIERRQRLVKPAQLKPWYRAVVELHEDARDVLLVELLTGLRQSEAMGLLWCDVDFAHKTITARDTKNGTDHMIPMSTHLAAILKDRFSLTGGGKFVFPGNGKWGHITDIRDSVKIVVAESGVEFTEHDLRRTFETTAESLDVSYYTLKRLLNHKTGADPTAGYIITSTARLRVAAQKIADVLAANMGMSTAKSKSAKTMRTHK